MSTAAAAALFAVAVLAFAVAFALACRLTDLQCQLELAEEDAKHNRKLYEEAARRLAVIQTIAEQE